MSKEKKDVADAEERRTRYDPIATLQAALAHVDAEGNARFGVYAMKAEWVRETLAKYLSSGD